jgi:hypothetical protein
VGTPAPVGDRLGEEAPGVVVVARVVVSSVGVLGSVVVSLGGGVVRVVVVGASGVVVGASDVVAGATTPGTSLVVPAGVAAVGGRT